MFTAEAMGVLCRAMNVENAGTTTRRGRWPSGIPRSDPAGEVILMAETEGLPDADIRMSFGAVLRLGFVTVNAKESRVLLLRL